MEAKQGRYPIYSLIFKNTGWTKGNDGKWRFEIPDKAKEINLKKFIAIDKKTGKDNLGKKFRLDEIYNNPELYEAYPQLRNITVFSEKFDNPNLGGYTSVDDNGNIEIALNHDSIVNKARGQQDPKRTLVHELQHAIQIIEDFAYGGSPESVKETLRESIKEAKDKLSKTPQGTSTYKRIQDSIAKMEKAVNSSDDEENLSDLYWNLGGEQEAREVESRMASAMKRKYSPTIHDSDALIVFDGKEYSMARIASPENKKAVVTVTGDEFGEYNSIGELRKKAIEYYINNLQGMSVFNEELGRIDIDKNGLIEFTTAGRKKVQSTGRESKKLLLVKHLPELLKGAYNVRTAESVKEKHSQDSFVYMNNEVKFDGDTTPVHITLVKRNNGDIQYYNHNFIKESEKHASEPARPESSKEALGTLPDSVFSDKNIPQGEDKIKYSFAGKKAKTADKDSLNRAIAMDERGANRDQIYRETGWVKGRDNKWRFEIPDNLNKINFVKLARDGRATLGEIYFNPKLYGSVKWIV